MKEGPDIALLGAMIGDPARANILIALMSGKALTATELASEAGVTVQTTSSHLKKLEDAGLLKRRSQGRHRYFELAGSDISDLLESMMGVAAERGLLRTQTGPKDEALKKARVCYNHLAGDFGVRLYDSLIKQGHLIVCDDETLSLSERGKQFVEAFGIDLQPISNSRRPICKSCLDWSERRTHLAGSLGTALLDQFIKLNWAKRTEGSRIIEFTRTGENKFLSQFEL